MRELKDSRAHRSATERHARSQLARLAHEESLIKGGVSMMARTCGKPNCKCAKGEKHVSLYISLRHNGKRKLIYVPPELEGRIKKGVKSYKEMMRLLDVISDISVERMKKAKATGKHNNKKS